MTSEQKIKPFLWFDGQAEEAMNHYVSVFKNSRVISVSRGGEAGRPGEKGKVFSCTFELEGLRFIALNGGPKFKFNEAISLFVSCETQAEVDELWARLSAGGSESKCGWLKDKFGVSWQIIPDALIEMFNDKDPQKSQRVMEAMLQMGKIDIATLRRAYDGPAGSASDRAGHAAQARKFVWYDLMTTDTAAAEAFYGKVVGWEAKDAGMPGGGYTLLLAGPTMLGGLMPIPEDACKAGVGPTWMGYIGLMMSTPMRVACRRLVVRSTKVRKIFRASDDLRSPATPTARDSCCSSPTMMGSPHLCPLPRPATLAGTSFTQAIWRVPSASIQVCSAGRKPM